MKHNLEARLDLGLQEVQALGSVAEEAYFERLRAELIDPVLSLPDLTILSLYRFLCNHDRADGTCHLAAARMLMGAGEWEAALAITSTVLAAEPRSVPARALWRDLTTRRRPPIHKSVTAPRRARSRA